MESVKISGVNRSSTGKKSTKATRSEGLVPCVIYGGENNVHFSAKQGDFRSLIYTPDFKKAAIEVDGATYECVVKDIQFHPVTDEIQHIDFVQLVSGNMVKLSIPVRFKGTAPGVKNGGKLTPKVRKVKVKTTPENIVSELMADISSMKLGDSIRVKDIELIGDMEMMSAPNTPIASVEVPRALKSAASKAEEDGAEGEAAEGEAGAGEE